MNIRYDEVKFNAGFYETSSLVYGYMAPVVKALKNQFFYILFKNLVRVYWLDFCPINVDANPKKFIPSYTIWNYGVFPKSIAGGVVNRKFNG